MADIETWNSPAMVGNAGRYMSMAIGVNTVSAPNRKISSKRRAGVREMAGFTANRLGHAVLLASRRRSLAPLTCGPMAESRKVGAFAPFEWMLALRYLRPKQVQGYVSFISVISLIGIALGVATLIIVMSVMNGFRHELLKSILGLNGHVTVQSADGVLPDFDALTQRLRAVPGVTRAAPVVDGQVMASQNGVNSGVLVRGVRPADLKSLTLVSSTLSQDALAGFDSGDEVIIGAGLARKMGIRVGGSITLIAPKGNVTPFGTTPRIKTYKVSGTFRVGMTQYDTSFIFMPLGEAQLFFNSEGGVSSIEVMVTDPDCNRFWAATTGWCPGRKPIPVSLRRCRSNAM
jgi:ABC-type lipoprotein release transport system permease subunit